MRYRRIGTSSRIRSDHPPDRHRCAGQVPTSAASRRGWARGYGWHPRLPHQLSRPGGQHHCRDLQGSLADRAVLQGAKAEPEDQDLRWHLGQRGQDTDLDSIDLDVATALSATVLPFRMEPVQSGRTVAHESVYPPRPDGLAQPAIRNTTRSAGPPPSSPGV